MANVTANERHEHVRNREIKNSKMKAEKKMFKHLIDDSNIVFCTLNSAGQAIFDNCEPFTHLIVDEAAQAVELSALIPFTRGVKSCILVGDPQQLPATVLSREARG